MSYKMAAALAACVGSVVSFGTGFARASLIVNGGFESSFNVTPPNYPNTSPGIPGAGGIGQLDYNTTVTGWSSPDVSYVNQTGFNFLWNPVTATTTGSNGYDGGIALHGPGNGFNNGFGPSPDGGQFLSADGDTRYNGRIQQTVTGLTAGADYRLSFYWALAQQFGAGGTPNGWWQVSLGADTRNTAMATLPAPGGFVAWRSDSFTFTATASTEVLTFLATEGGPFGGAPFLLLDGVSLDAVAPVPEPSAMLAAGLGLGAAAALRGIRRRGRPASA